MSSPFIDPRHIIPNWRPFRITAAMGELDLSRAKEVTLQAQDPLLLEEKKRELEKHPLLSTAGDLLTTALGVDDKNGIELAGRFIHEFAGQGGEFAKATLDRLARNRRSDILQPELKLNRPKDERFRRIRDLKKSVREDPRNAVVYIDLARLYAILGQIDKAQENVERALLLNGTNRFVLRAAARFFVHTGDTDRALHLISRSPGLLSDPWLLATELATMDILGKSSRHVRNAKEMLASNSFRQRHLSELAAALATQDLEAGRDKKADKFFQHILQYPTENSLAQLCSFPSLIFKHDIVSIIQERIQATPRTFEANANLLMDSSEWEKSFEQAERWLSDQPFSSRPAIFASFLASNVLGEPQKAVEIINTSIICNPNDPLMLNNRAFSLIQLERFEEARRDIVTGLKVTDDPRFTVALIATQGMLELRGGDKELGKSLYQIAISKAVKSKNSTQRQAAEMHFAVELHLAGQPSADLDKTLEKGAQSNDKLVRASSAGLKRWIKKAAEAAASSLLITTEAEPQRLYNRIG